MASRRRRNPERAATTTHAAGTAAVATSGIGRHRQAKQQRQARQEVKQAAEHRSSESGTSQRAYLGFCRILMNPTQKAATEDTNGMNPGAPR